MREEYHNKKKKRNGERKKCRKRVYSLIITYKRCKAEIIWKEKITYRVASLYKKVTDSCQLLYFICKT